MRPNWVMTILYTVLFLFMLSEECDWCPGFGRGQRVTWRGQFASRCVRGHDATCFRSPWWLAQQGRRSRDGAGTAHGTRTRRGKMRCILYLSRLGRIPHAAVHNAGRCRPRPLLREWGRNGGRLSTNRQQGQMNPPAAMLASWFFLSSLLLVASSSAGFRGFVCVATHSTVLLRYLPI